MCEHGAPFLGAQPVVSKQGSCWVSSPGADVVVRPPNVDSGEMDGDVAKCGGGSVLLGRGWITRTSQGQRPTAPPPSTSSVWGLPPLLPLSPAPGVPPPLSSLFAELAHENPHWWCPHYALFA